ncbi:unnamed protein product [Clonostachys byssicola]|uniref:Uncharacterized protein n=1 Tax=Clonostachys byssicola TaxID=160290 RepID=A0A9N9UXA9_9HYPO|nr:unnamed protein product [Clonostachys byssicola]
MLCVADRILLSDASSCATYSLACSGDLTGATCARNVDLLSTMGSDSVHGGVGSDARSSSGSPPGHNLLLIPPRELLDRVKKAHDPGLERNPQRIHEQREVPGPGALPAPGAVVRAQHLGRRLLRVGGREPQPQRRRAPGQVEDVLGRRVLRGGGERPLAVDGVDGLYLILELF